MIDASAIILATRPQSLRLCLRSLELASPKPTEILVVLNGNDDDCAAAAGEFAAALPGLAVLRGAPRSLGGARNAALARARGSWLCFLDDDVTVPPEYFVVFAEKRRSHRKRPRSAGPTSRRPAARCSSAASATSWAP